MANTCSFKIDGYKYKNFACFAELICEHKSCKKIIIIEKVKQNKHGFTKEEIDQYLNDLQTMGFLFTYEMVNNSYHLKIDSNIKKVHLRALCMAVRYIWEKQQNYTMDNFFVTIIHFNNLKKEYPNDNLLTLFCLAHNLAVLNELISYNSNHYWCYYTGCKLITSLNQIAHKEYVNDAFCNNIELPILKKQNKNNNLYNFLKKQYNIK
jgi:hypothetical protein